MSDRWIRDCVRALERIRELSSKEDKDRLERLNSIKTSLTFLNRSLSGWIRWANNPSAMANFSDEELEGMERQLSSIAESFIEYDIKATKLGIEKGLKKRATRRKSVNFIV